MDIKNHLIELEKSLLTFEVRHSKERLIELISTDFNEIGASGAYFGLDRGACRFTKRRILVCSSSRF
jgi:hypothetical protein